MQMTTEELSLLLNALSTHVRHCRYKSADPVRGAEWSEEAGDTLQLRVKVKRALAKVRQENASQVDPV